MLPMHVNFHSGNEAEGLCCIKVQGPTIMYYLVLWCIGGETSS